MLTDQDKARILEEETYRREVRAGLDMAKPKGARWQKFLSVVNSPVFIWFLSSFVLGVASFLYNHWYVVGAENQRTANKLNAEITSRLIYFNNLLLMFREGEGTFSLDMSKLVIALDRPSAVDYPVNVFPEYLNRNLRSLLWELMQVVPDDATENIKRAYQKSLSLQEIYLKGPEANKHAPNEPISVSEIRASRKNYLATREFYCAFNLKQWGNPFEELIKLDAGKPGCDSTAEK
jgi:hypothetical protein